MAMEVRYLPMMMIWHIPSEVLLTMECMSATTMM